MLQSIYGDLAEKFALNYCLSSDDFVSAQYTPFPKKNLETCILSIAHAILMQPLRVKTVAVTRNSIPVGSKANTGRNALDRMVKMGEKRSMTNVLRPIKKESRLACAGR